MWIRELTTNTSTAERTIGSQRARIETMVDLFELVKGIDRSI